MEIQMPDGWIIAVVAIVGFIAWVFFELRWVSYDREDATNRGLMEGENE